MFDLNG